MKREDFVGKVISTPVVFDTHNSVENFNHGSHIMKVYIGYAGDNRNYSSISKETFENMIPSLYGAPIVGEFDEDAGDFKSHGEEIIITDEGVEYRKNTHAYGYIDSQSRVAWTKNVEEDNPEREYLTVDACIWTDYFAEARKVLDGKNNQSMEIEILDGDFRDDGIFEITEARFLSLCILGEDVEPAFEGASIRKYNLGEKFNSYKMQEVQDGGADKKMEEMKKKIANFEAEIEDMKAENEKLQEQNEQLDTELNETKEEYAAVQEELEELREQNEELAEFKKTAEIEKKTAEVEDVFADFNIDAMIEDEIITKETYAELKEKAIDEMSIVELEKELSYMLVKAEREKPAVQDDTTVESFDLNTDIEEPEATSSSYGELVKYIK